MNSRLIKICNRVIFIGLFLVAISLLFSVSPAFGAWLSGWGKRVKITTDNTDIDSAVSNFPVLIYLSSASGRDSPKDDVTFVFDEVGSNSKRIAVTTSDGTTQCYVEIEKWDSVSEKAWLWVKAPSISSTADTDFYLYYDNTQADNTTYVGDKESTPAQNVWDGNFKLVQHLNEDPSGAAPQMKDCTSNNNDGTSGGSMTSGDQVTGQVDGSLDFEGTDDYVDVGNFLDFSATPFTIEVWFKPDVINQADQNTFISKWSTITGQREFRFEIDGSASDNILFHTQDGEEYYNLLGSTLTAGNWYYAAVTIDWAGDDAYLYLNGAVDVSSDTWTQGINYATSPVIMASRRGVDQWFDGIIDEVRVSDSVRNASWIKASYESERDDLVDFGSEEQEPTSEVVVDAVSSGAYAGPIHTHSHTTGSGNDRLMVVGISWGSPVFRTLDDVTYNGTSLTKLGSEYNGNGCKIDIWYMINPSSGTADVVATFSETGVQSVIGVITFEGVDQTTPLGTFASAQGSTSPATVDVSGASGDLIMDTVCSLADPTVHASQTERWNLQTITTRWGGGSTEVNGASTTMSWTFSNADWTIGGVAVKPVVPPGWLSGWANRVKMTIDQNDIDDSVSNFPVLVYLSFASGRDSPKDDVTFVFDEVGSNSKKIAVTTSDGVTQCYVEIEKWDSVSEKAWLWVKVPNISSTADTDLYLYYDNTQADNTTYVGDVGSTPGQAVWDANFIGVWHLKEDPSGTPPQMKDSTLPANNGTSGGTMLTEDQVPGKVDGSLDFDGSNDLINLGNSTDFNVANITVSAWTNFDSTVSASWPKLISKGSPEVIQIYWDSTAGTPNYVAHIRVGASEYLVDGDSIRDTMRHYVMTYDGETLEFLINNVSQGTNTSPSGNLDTNTANLVIANRLTDTRYWKGIIDEVRISDTARSIAWIKASYESERDDLVDFEGTGVPILSVSISTDTYNFGTFFGSTITVSGASITVENDGNVTETYSIKCSSSSYWAVNNTAGNDEFTLQAAFHPSQPSNDDISWKADDILTESLQQCTTAAFSIDGSEHGKDVPPFEIRNIWFRLKTPLSTSTTTQQSITVTISAEQSP